MSLFTSGDNGTFDSTVDPNGNPPSDWNIIKAADSIVEFNNVNPITGTGSMHCESRTIFNNDYAFDFNSTLTIVDNDKKQILLDQDNALDFNQDFTLEFEIYPKNLNYSEAQEYFSRGNSSNIRIAIIRNTDTLVVEWTDSSSTKRQLTRTLIANQWNLVTLTFIQGASVTLDVDGSSISNTAPSQCSVENGSDETIQLKYGGIGVVGGSDRVVFDGLHRNCKFTFNSVLVKEYKLNQEQGRKYFDSVNEEFSATCNNNYPDSELQFGGGAWIDTTTL